MGYNLVTETIGHKQFFLTEYPSMGLGFGHSRLLDAYEYGHFVNTLLMYIWVYVIRLVLRTRCVLY
jgi:hypothetical protein